MLCEDDNAKPGHFRAFIGIALDAGTNDHCDHLVKHLARPLARYRPDGQDHPIRWVTRENRHITLAFLDQISATQAEALCRQMRETLAKIPIFRVEIGPASGFPRAQSPVIAADISPDPTLIALYQLLQALCHSLGLREEAKRFRPHITLGRQRAKQRKPCILPLVSTPKHAFTVKRIQLFQSTLSSEGSHYQVLDEIGLGESG